MSNTPLSGAELARLETAILLESAFIDTDRELRVDIPAELRDVDEPGAFLVQCRGAIDPGFSLVLAGHGARIVSYIPNNTLLVQASRQVAAAIEAESRVRAVLPFEPFYKLKSPILHAVQSRPAETAETSSGVMQVRLLIASGEEESARKALQAIGAQSEAYGQAQPERSPFGSVVSASLTMSQVVAFARAPWVLAIEPSYPRVAASDLSRATLGVSPGPATQINHLGLTGSNVVVSLNDTGVDAAHPDLVGRVVPDVPSSGIDPVGHGTLVAGIIAGDGGESLSVTYAPGSPVPAQPRQFRGGAPCAELFSIAVDLERRSGPSDQHLQEESASSGALISNNSWLYQAGTSSETGAGDYDLAAASYDAAVRDSLPLQSGAQPLVFVFPSGNLGAGGWDGAGGMAGSIPSPATAKNVITVGAVEQLRSITNGVCPASGWPYSSDASNQVAGFSGRGNVGVGREGDWGRFKPDVVAPGTWVVGPRSTGWDQARYYDATNFVACPEESLALSNLNESVGPFYRFESGTSLAAGAVSGALALIQEFFEQCFEIRPSPALMKAVLVNGARPLAALGPVNTRATTNLQGWGMANLPNSVPAGLTNPAPAARPMLWFDCRSAVGEQPALATGARQTRIIRVPPGSGGLPLRLTLAWSDPPANPLAGIRLVNDLDLCVTNLDTGEIYLGNDLDPASGWSRPWDGGEPGRDLVNNVENVFVAPGAGANFAVAVVGHRVNVPAADDAAHRLAQDYALVISSGDAEHPGGLDLVEASTDPAAAPDVVTLTNTFPAGSALFGSWAMGQRAGAHPPVPGSPLVPFPDAPGQVLSIGAANQWAFFAITNETEYTNAAFLTVLPESLAIDRGSVVNPAAGASTNSDCDLDLYVSRDPALLALDPAVLATAWRSASRGAEETVLLDDASPGPFFIAVKCESPSAASFNLLAAFSESAFAEADWQGNQSLHGFPVPAPIPVGDGSYGPPVNVLAVPAESRMARRVIVTNALTHPDPADLLVGVAHGPQAAVLHRHASAPPGTVVRVYDDSRESVVPNARPSDGPGSLQGFSGANTAGHWRLWSASTNRPGAVESVGLWLEAQPDLSFPVTRTLEPGAEAVDHLYVPPGATNLAVSALLSSGAGPVGLSIRLADAASEACPGCELTSEEPNQRLLLDAWSIPPLNDGLYRVVLTNRGNEAVEVALGAQIASDSTPPEMLSRRAGEPLVLEDTALNLAALEITNAGSIAELDASVRIDHPRVSDLVLTIVSPSGTRVRLAAHRGGASTNGLGTEITVTNLVPVSSSGGPRAYTNTLDIGRTSGVLDIQYNFYSLPDRMNIYYEDTRIFASGMKSGSNTVSVPFGPGASTFVTVVMNEGDNYSPETAWDYVVTSKRLEPMFARFTESTNVNAAPVKFAPPPYDIPTAGAPAGSSPALWLLPESSLALLRGEPAAGTWKLEIQDSTSGPVYPKPAELRSWQLDYRLIRTAPLPLPVTNDEPRAVTLGPGRLQWFTITPPLWARFATNSIRAATLPVSVLFNPIAPPTGTNAQDVLLASSVTALDSVLAVGQVPGFLPGAPYFIGVSNQNASPVSFTFETHFDVYGLADGAPATAQIGPDDPPFYFMFQVEPEVTGLQFDLAASAPGLDLVLRKGGPVPTLEDHDYVSALPGDADESIVVTPFSAPVPLAAGRWYVGVFNTGFSNAAFTLRATQYTNVWPDLVTLMDGVPHTASNPGPAGSSDYYRFVVEPHARRAQFEISELSGEAALLLRRGLPLPTPDDFDLASANPGTNQELIVVYAGVGPVPLTPGEWFVAAVNLAPGPLSYTISASQQSDPGILRITSFTRENGQVCLTWNSVPGAWYHVEGQTAIGVGPGWTNISGSLPSADFETSWCGPDQPWAFFRVAEGLAPTPEPGPPAIRTISLTAQGVVLEWVGSPDDRYVVESTADLAAGNWVTGSQPIASPIGLFRFIDAPSSPPKYYRLRLEPR